ncbi:helix-turn-helix domain-containing protein [Aeromicrobium sp.]|uniref:arsenate reductase/protein-tyrosine-phosphatase family protein n=1 Tax=Aeromicrobium sp. TaxID=1871063 RepID=UPI003C324A6C
MNVERLPLAERAAWHAALADVARLAIVDHLALGDRSPSELQALIGLRSNLLAHHLKVLEQAGVVVRRRSEGDRRRTYLTLAPVDIPSADVAVHVNRVVFVCSANSARSQLAAALWTKRSTVRATSAGTHPADRIAAGALAVAERRSLPLLSVAPQPLTQVEQADDFVIAVCDNAYEELGAAVSLHWSIPDPVARGGADAFEATCAELDRRIATLAPRLIAS